MEVVELISISGERFPQCGEHLFLLEKLSPQSGQQLSILGGLRPLSGLHFSAYGKVQTGHGAVLS